MLTIMLLTLLLVALFAGLAVLFNGLFWLGVVASVVVGLAGIYDKVRRGRKNA